MEKNRLPKMMLRCRGPLIALVVILWVVVLASTSIVAALKVDPSTKRRHLQMDNNNDNNNDQDVATWTDDNDKSSWSNTDQFTYKNERLYSPNNVYPPDEWVQVGCPDQDVCLGWPESFDAAVGWDFTANHCIWCPEEGGNNCGKHHSSPINLFRSVAIAGNPKENVCIDVHWMHYIDSSCTFEMLQNLTAFTIERHALKIKQPMEQGDDGKWRNACKVPRIGSRWGRIDFSRGFSQWWFLSHIDLHIPSEHTQEGHHYSGELQMYHFYSIDTDGTEYVTNELSALSVFLEAYDDVPDYDVLNRLICQWRRAEEQTREECGLPSVTTDYPGCYNFQRGREYESPSMAPSDIPLMVPTIVNKESPGNATGPGNATAELLGNNTEPGNATEKTSVNARMRKRGRQLDEKDDDRKHLRRDKTKTAYDIFMHNYMSSARDPSANENPQSIHVDAHEFDEIGIDWDAFIQSVYEEEEWARNGQGHRHLLDYAHVAWHNYFPLLGCKTEYYYRYSGTQTIPPCYGRLRLAENNRENTNHWRIMKDPIRISQRQLLELHRLIKNRIAPVDDPIRKCKPDTAAAPDPDGDPAKISVARPLQSFHEAHWLVFCECENWVSKWQEDQDWCLDKNKTHRFFEQPYNYKMSGF